MEWYLGYFDTISQGAVWQIPILNTIPLGSVSRCSSAIRWGVVPVFLDPPSHTLDLVLNQPNPQIYIPTLTDPRP
jgi:hypothetical protein